MEALECIKTRRSIRKFTEQPVTEDEVRQVVEAAAFAPSWKNTQIARYIVVTDKEKKDKLADDCMLDFAFNQKTTHGALGTGRADHDQEVAPATSATAHSAPRLLPTGSPLTRALPRRPSALPRTRSVSARSSWAFTIPPRLPRS